MVGSKHEHNMLTQERGASAVLIAGAMMLLFGVAAVALDVSSAFNERNQNQNAGDNGVMAGAIEKSAPNPDDQAISTSVLEIVQANLTADFPGGLNDADWISMWRGCIDDDNPGWTPLPEPSSWGGAAGATLDCISHTSSLLRVRVPDQLVDTTFGAVLGLDAIGTNAVSIAKMVLLTNAPPMVPFGINSGAGPGEYCLSSASDGNAFPPCDGSQTGSFGPIISPLFGTIGSHPPDCDGNTLRWFERNLVWGLDHPIEEYEHASSIPPGTPWTQAYFDSLADIHRDDCDVFEGIAVEVDGFPINAVRVDTGFPNPEMTNALVSDQTFDGRPSRLQQQTDPLLRRTVMDKNDEWDLDNVGPWTYLTDTSGIPECQGSTYDSSLSTDDKLLRFQTCLSSPTVGEIFSPTITSSPRFVWAPEYALGNPPGSKFTPIREFRPVFLGGVWFNCPNPNSGQPCGIVFYPDQDATDVLCDGTYPSCKSVNVDQISSWLLPNGTLPPSVWDDFDARNDDREPQLFQ